MLILNILYNLVRSIESRALLSILSEDDTRSVESGASLTSPGNMTQDVFIDDTTKPSIKHTSTGSISDRPKCKAIQENLLHDHAFLKISDLCPVCKLFDVLCPIACHPRRSSNGKIKRTVTNYAKHYCL